MTQAARPRRPFVFGVPATSRRARFPICLIRQKRPTSAPLVSNRNENVPDGRNISERGQSVSADEFPVTFVQRLISPRIYYTNRENVTVQ